MSKDRDAKEFDADLKKGLVDRGYTIYEIGGNISRPDIVAIKDKTALIIETKSEKEPKDWGCLRYDNPDDEYRYYDECQAWRKYCLDLQDGYVAIWMVYINLQALCYPEFFQKSGENISYGWYLKDETANVELEGCTRIPALAFPEIYKNQVQEAVRLMGIVIDESQFMELGSGQFLLKFDSGQKMIEPAPNVWSSKS